MSIIPLISSWEKYIDTHPDGDIQDFARWIQVSPVPPPDPLTHAGQTLSYSTNLDAAAYSTLLVNRLHHINAFFAKPIIRKLGFTNDMEFGVLVQVYLMDRPNKKELCRELLIENSTGVEITRRLTKKGLLRETIDPDDRRAARLSVTEKGEDLLIEGHADLSGLHKNFLAPLAPEEQKQLVGILARLHEFHSARIATTPNKP
jgi:DNA-binding MarR family transcriptional regulator